MTGPTSSDDNRRDGPSPVSIDDLLRAAARRELAHPDTISQSASRAFNEPGPAHPLLSFDMPWHRLNERLPPKRMHELATTAAEISEQCSPTERRSGLVFVQTTSRRRGRVHGGGTTFREIHNVTAYRNNYRRPVLISQTEHPNMGWLQSLGSHDRCVL